MAVMTAPRLTRSTVSDPQPPAYNPDDRNVVPQSDTAQARAYGGLASNLNPLGPAGGFAYDEQTLHGLVKDWRAMAQEFRDDRARAEALAKTEGPGLEYASGGNAEMIRASGEVLLKTISGRADYCDAMADKFVAALGKYARAEETQIADMKKPEGLA